jgi:hypothetical protein
MVAMTLELSGVGRLRPQATDQALNIDRATVLLDDESVRTTVTAKFLDMAEVNSFSASFPVLVLQRQDGTSDAWTDFHTFQRTVAAVPERPILRLATPVPGVLERIDRRTLIDPDSLVTRPQPDPFDDPTHTVLQGEGSINTVPEGPRQPHDFKTGPPFPSPNSVVPNLSFDSPSLRLPVGTVAIRASARRADGTSLDSSPLRLEVRRAPAILTLLSMGGGCPTADGNTSDQNLASAGIIRDRSVCDSKGVPATFLGDLTPMASVNCNNPCNTGCTNFLEHLGLRIMNNRNLANELDSINNPGTAMCDRRVNQNGIRNRIIFGKWRNTEEEDVCSTSIQFNSIIDNFVSDGGKSLILVGQSQGGAKFAGMVRDHWRWGNDLTLELIALWDATSFDVVSFSGHVGLGSMGVRRVGSRPRKVLTFFQYSNPVPFQNGAPLDPAEQHADAEQHDLDVCFSHNAIARSQFVHRRTADAVKEALQAARDRAR